MLKQNRGNVTGTIGDFVDMLVACSNEGTEQERVYKALATLENNGVVDGWQVAKFKDEYANGDYVVRQSTSRA